MLAIAITSVTYVGFAIICGATVMRQATGNIEDLYNGTLTNCTEGCEWGLQNSFQVRSSLRHYLRYALKKNEWKSIKIEMKTGYWTGFGFRSFDLRRLFCGYPQLCSGQSRLCTQSVPGFV